VRRPTNKQELSEQLVYEQCVRIGLCAILGNLVVAHTKLLGGDQENALANIEAGLRKTVGSMKIEAKDIKGGSKNISATVQSGVEKMLTAVFRDARKQLAPKSVH
jgi:hypothetical protein